MLCCVAAPAPAAGPGSDITLPMQRYGVRQGLPPVQLIQLQQDARGYLWIASNDGLIRFDGREFQRFRHRHGDPASLPDSDVSTILSDPDGKLWVGLSSAGLALRDADGHAFRPVNPPATKAAGQSIWSLARTADTLFIGGVNGLVAMPLKGSQSPLSIPEKLKKTVIFSMAADGDGGVWIGTFTHGLAYRRRDGSYRYWETGNSKLCSNKIRHVVALPGQVALASTDTGLARVDALHNTVRCYTKGLTETRLNAVLEDTQQRIWVASDSQGVYVLAPGKETFQRVRAADVPTDAMAHERVFDILQDKLGGLWFATLQGTLYHLPPQWNAFSLPFDQQSDLSGTRVVGTHVLGQSLYLATLDRGLLALDPSTHVTRTIPLADSACEGSDANGGNYAQGLAETADTLWFGGRNNLYRLDPKSGHTSAICLPGTNPESRESRWVSQLLADGNGRLWLNLDQHRLLRFDPTTDSFLRIALASGSAAKLHHISYDRSHHEVLAVLNERILAIDVNNLHPRVLSLDAAIVNNETAWMKPGPAGKILIGGNNVLLAQRNGLRLTTEKIFQHNVDYPDESMVDAAWDGSDRVWGVSRAGLTRFNVARGTAQTFTLDDGLPSASFRADSLSRQGSLLYAGTERGLLQAKLDALLERHHPVTLTLTEVRAGNQSLAISAGPGIGHVTLPYDAPVLAVSVAVLDYRNPARHRLRYKLDDEHAPWHMAGHQHTLTFAGLRPGQHNLTVSALSDAGYWIEPPLRLSFLVQARPSLMAGGGYWYLASLLLLLIFLAYRRAHRASARQIGA